MILNTDRGKTDQSALIVSLVILVVSFVGVIVFLACCSECPRPRLFHRGRVPEEPGPETPLRPGTPPPSQPIAIPGAVATSRHRPVERGWPNAGISSGGPRSWQSSGETTDVSFPDSVPSEHRRELPPRSL